MNGTEQQRPLRGAVSAAAPAHPRQPRPFTSVGEGQRIRSTGNADMQQPSLASVPHGPALSRSGDHTLSSIDLSSDTASLSLEASSVPPLLLSDPAIATATAVRKEVLPPVWWDVSSSLLPDDSATPRGISSVNAGGDGAAKSAFKAPPDSSSLLPGKWRCSIDFSHEIESRAEAELQQLWATLWAAAHSELALVTALEGPRTQWNPYRPTRGGQEVREEVLNSEVAEFKRMIPVDSLYLRGTAIKPVTRVVHGVMAGKAVTSVAAGIINSTNTTSLDRLPHKSEKLRDAQARKRRQKNDEDVLMLDHSSVDLHPPALHTLAGTLGETAGVDAHYTEAWWTAHRADGEAALFQYLWETVVVPFYISTATSPLNVPATSLDPASTTDASASRTLTRAEDEDEKDVSGMVTPFWPAQGERRQWVLESGLRSSSPSPAQTSLSTAEVGNNDGRHPSPLARTPRSGGGGGSGLPPPPPSQSFTVVPDDSLEVEVLDDVDCHIGGGALKAHEAHSPARLGRENTAGPTRVPPAKRNPPRRHGRPSTAGVQGTVLSPIEDVPLGMPIPVSRNGAALAAKQRARSARTGDVAALTNGSSPTQLRTDVCSGWKWAKTPPLRTTLMQSPAEVKLSALPLPKPTSATRQRPPTAQPLVSKGRRTASPSECARAEAACSTSGSRCTGGDTAVNKTTLTAGAAKSHNNCSTSSASPSSRRKTTRGNALRARRPPWQLNTNANVSANHALQLLELRSRSASRSPYVQRMPSPFAPSAPLHNHSNDAEGSGEWEGPRRGRRTQVSPQLEEMSDVKTPRGRGRLSPVTAAALTQEKRRRSVDGGGTNRSKDSSTSPDRLIGSATSISHVEQGEKTSRTPKTFAIDGTEKVVPKARLAPLRETAVHSSTPQEESAAVPASQRGTTAHGYTPFVKSHRQ